MPLEAETGIAGDGKGSENAEARSETGVHSSGVWMGLTGGYKPRQILTGATATNTLPHTLPLFLARRTLISRREYLLV